MKAYDCWKRGLGCALPESQQEAGLRFGAGVPGSIPMQRLSAPERTREELRALMNGDLGTPEGRSDLVCVSCVDAPLDARAFFKFERVVRRFRVSGLIVRQFTRRGPVWKLEDQVQIGVARSRRSETHWFSDPVSLTVRPHP